MDEVLDGIINQGGKITKTELPELIEFKYQCPECARKSKIRRCYFCYAPNGMGADQIDFNFDE